MTTTQHITSDIIYIGASEGRHPLFENIYPVPNGMSYNSYLIADKRTVLMDTADSSVREEFLSNLGTALNGRTLDDIVVHHMEPDHAALLAEILTRYPHAQVICSAKTKTLMAQFFETDFSDRIRTVAEGETISFGRHNLTFYMAPMVHWPEVMVSYDSTDKILFAADAFGTFGELNGSLWADKTDFETFVPEARRYYTNIVGKYGNQVQALLKKAAALDIQMICPLHGPIWRQNLAPLLDKYNKWSSYTPEDNAVLIVFGSIYGHTESVARRLSAELAKRGIESVVYDAAKTHPSYLVAEAFRCSKIVVASVTYNNGIFPPIESFLLDMRAHNLQNREIHLIQNGSWAPASGKLMTALLSDMKGITLDPTVLTLTSSFKPTQEPDLTALIDRLTS